MDIVKIVVGVPESHADAVREAIGNAGAGKFGNYSFCSFSSKGVGRFLAGKGSHPAVGTIGKLEEVIEERIEVTCQKDLVDTVVKAIKKAHPYEVPVIDIYPLLNT
jgi:hypothetical protein